LTKREFTNCPASKTLIRRLLMKQTEPVEISRRRLVAMTSLSAGAALLTGRPLFANSSFSSLKQIDAGVLNVAYAETGPSNGPAVTLLHGWPYDIHSYAEVAPLLASAGCRVIVPYLRGYGATHFLSSETVRNGQQSVIAVDIVALMDALSIEKAILAGFDWGARTANIISALWPERCRGLVSVSGYLIGSPEANKAPLPPKAELAW
jgi:pimeloyl-ACP methyl ester carboxylesterase